MLIAIGAVIVIGSVIGGFLWEKGNLYLLYQPAELLIIGGSGVGAFIIGSSTETIRSVVHGLKSVMVSKPYVRKDYLEALKVLNGVFAKIRKDGLISLESHLNAPKKSDLFKKHPEFLKNEHALNLLTDTLRSMTTIKLTSHQLEALLETEIETYHEELMVSSKGVANMADSFPGLGIVAAVLGVVVTMTKITEPAEVLGHSIGAALVGTFLGILLCYGFMGPIARRLEGIADQEKEYLVVLKTVIVSFVSGLHPQMSIEFGRMLIPDAVRPSFHEVEEIIRQAKKAEAKPAA
ncbi:MAG: flagellar motor stator protein MotA [Nitrospinae bacterium]|nr:flagellar motor stator protein MotA [Nitrospinota bacterium]